MLKPKQSITDYFKIVLRDPESKPAMKIVRDLLLLLIKFKIVPVHYFSRFLFLKNSENITDYFPDQKIRFIQSEFNIPSYNHLLRNKLLFNIYFSRHGFKVPRIILHNVQKFVYCGDDITVLSNFNDFVHLIDKIFREYTKYDTILIKKQLRSTCESDTMLISWKDLTNKKETLKEYYAKYISSEFIIEEVLIQHPGMDTLNSAKINILQIDTFRDKNNVTSVISAMMRTCRNKISAENSVSGDLYVGIDLDKSTLKEEAYSSFKHSLGFHCKHHPVSGIAFKNFPIPYFKESKQMVLSAAERIPGNRLIGWNIAITDDGPVMVEGATDYDILNAELTYGGYKRNKVFSKAIKELTQ